MKIKQKTEKIAGSFLLFFLFLFIHIDYSFLCLLSAKRRKSLIFLCLKVDFHSFTYSFFNNALLAFSSSTVLSTTFEILFQYLINFIDCIIHSDYN